MPPERTSDIEFQNVLDVTSKHDLPSSAKLLITELFERVKALESPGVGDRLSVLNSIIEGMNGDLEELGDSPTNGNLRDRMRSVTTAVRDLAQYLADERDSHTARV
jgi:hypothetical protein